VPERVNGRHKTCAKRWVVRPESVFKTHAAWLTDDGEAGPTVQLAARSVQRPAVAPDQSVIGIDELTTPDNYARRTRTASRLHCVTSRHAAATRRWLMTHHHLSVPLRKTPLSHAERPRDDPFTYKSSLPTNLNIFITSALFNVLAVLALHMLLPLLLHRQHPLLK